MSLPWRLLRLAAWPLRRGASKLGYPLSRRDRRIAGLADRHRGQRAFILGNGPSLQVSDLDLLQDEITFASNKIYLAFDDTPWRPTYYSVIDVLVARNNRDAILRLDELDHLHSVKVQHVLGQAHGGIYIDTLPQLPLLGPHPGFSGDLLAGCFSGSTVIYLQLQLAFFMGIREVYLLGIDFSFEVPKGSVTEQRTEHGEAVISSQGEVNHFHPEYRKPGETWTMPKLEAQKRAFRCARQAFERAGGRLVNASRRTALETLPLGDLDAVLATPGPRASQAVPAASNSNAS